MLDNSSIELDVDSLTIIDSEFSENSSILKNQKFSKLNI